VSPPGSLRSAATVSTELSARGRRVDREGGGPLSPSGVALAILLVLLPVTVLLYRPAWRLVYLAWMLPLAELALLAAGQFYYRFRYREAPSRFRELIIQITTTGAEPGRVNEIIAQIRGYDLTIDYEVWVVTEPDQPLEYPLADKVLVVPPHFTVAALHKARALEYSRLARSAIGLDRDDVKVLFIDDDVSLTRSYIERAFAADYDLAQGVITPRTAYSLRPFGHFAVSHADDFRTHACLIYCSVFQGILRRPLHVHGEGLAVTGRAERLITWDFPLVASEDLAFGHRARRHGLTWGWFHEYAEVTSPWSIGDFLIQRNRWVWGDIHAIRHRSVLPLSGALLVSAKYLIGVLGLACSAAGLYLRATGRLPPTSAVLDYAKLSVLCWSAVFFACGWIGASSPHAGRDSDSRLLSGVVAVLMLPVSAMLTFAAVVISLALGDPRTFRIIRKTR
jgi:Glycosyl transferase family group 2